MEKRNQVETGGSFVATSGMSSVAVGRVGARVPPKVLQAEGEDKTLPLTQLF